MRPPIPSSSSLLVLAVALSTSTCSGEPEPGPRRGLEPVTLVSPAVTLSAQDGGELAVDGARLRVPPGALFADATLTFTLVETPRGGEPLREVEVSPHGVAFKVPATLEIDLFVWEAPAPEPFEVIVAGNADLVTREGDRLLVELHTTGQLMLARGSCDTPCDPSERCAGGRCVRACAADDDCPSWSSCARGMVAATTVTRTCDEARGLCVVTSRTATACDRPCDLDTTQCPAADACPPPSTPWAGDRGFCVVGFPELGCLGDAEPGPPCDTSADCVALGGTALCVRPGALYPDECYDGDVLLCGYIGPCAALCPAR